MSRGLNPETKQKTVEEFRTHEGDTGSSAVQVAVLSKRIDQLTRHVQGHKRDHHTRLGLTKLVQKRRRLLDYLQREDYERYKDIVERLGIRRR